MGGRHTMSTSQPGARRGPSARRTARSRRRTRLRTTAFPSRRPVDSPNLVRPRSFGANRAARRGCTLLLLVRWSAAKSRRDRSISGREPGGGPTRSGRPFRRSDDDVPWRGARRGHGGHPGSSCGRGNRAPWRDVASWAGTSAWSSRTVGSWASEDGAAGLGSCPRGTETRPALPSGGPARGRCGASGRGIICDCRQGVSNERAPAAKNAARSVMSL
jgi:hypothetical protein